MAPGSSGVQCSSYWLAQWGSRTGRNPKLRPGTPWLKNRLYESTSTANHFSKHIAGLLWQMVHEICCLLVSVTIAGPGSCTDYISKSRLRFHWARSSKICEEAQQRIHLRNNGTPFFVTHNGLMGLTSPWTLFGDIVSIFSGAKTPFTLRIDNEVGKVPSVYTSLARHIFMALWMVKSFPLVELKLLSCGRRH